MKKSGQAACELICKEWLSPAKMGSKMKVPIQGTTARESIDGGWNVPGLCWEWQVFHFGVEPGLGKRVEARSWMVLSYKPKKWDF